MADKLNSMKVRLCAVVWDLVEMGFFEGRRAMTVLNRIENMSFGRSPSGWAYSFRRRIVSRSILRS